MKGMKYIIKLVWCVLIVSSVLTSSVIAQEGFSFRQRLVITNDSFPKYGTEARFEALIFGVEAGATDAIDTLLGEFEVPNHPPQPQLSAFFIIPDKSNGTVSYIDLRGVPAEEKFYREYEFDIQRGYPGRLYIQWTLLPSDKVDSAVLCDIYTGDLVRFDMMKTNKAEIAAEPSGIRRFYIKIWYNKNTTDYYDEDLNKSVDFDIFPNPAEDKLYLKYIGDNFSYKIYTIIGRCILYGQLINGSNCLNIEDLVTGIYIFEFTDSRGRKVFRKFMVE
jgi:hypothetical protein